MLSSRGWAVLVALAMLWPLHADATQVAPVGVAKMARDAAVVVRARVGKRDVRWDAARERILTFTELTVLQGYKGARAGEVLTVYQVGGRLDGVVMEIHGAIELRPGEEIVLFAQRHKQWIVSYGIGLGKLTVLERDKQRIATPDYGDVTFVERGGASAEAPLREAIPLAELDRRIRDAIAAGAAR